MSSASVEDYIKVIYTLQTTNMIVTTSSIARHMNISAPSVTGMLRNLVDKKLVKYQPYKGTKLTARGRKLALKILRSHRLIELFLVEILDVPWDQVHQEAEKLEHVISDEVLDRIDKKLNYPTRDPHGSQIPDRDGKYEKVNSIPLCDLPAGKSGVIAEVADNDPEFLSYLAELNLKPGAKFKIDAISQSGGIIHIKSGKNKYVISLDAAKRIFIHRSQ